MLGCIKKKKRVRISNLPEGEVVVSLVFLWLQVVCIENFEAFGPKTKYNLFANNSLPPVLLSSLCDSIEYSRNLFHP